MNSKYVVNLQGRDYPVYSGVLSEAHERGIQGIETELIQIPDESNGDTAIVKATVRMKDGSVFSDYGDANPRNTSARVATALIRLASTRAKGRALRDSTNIGDCMAEELPDLEEVRAQEPPQMQRSEPAAGGGDMEPVLACSIEGCGCVLNQAQHTLSVNKYSRPLCPTHQRAVQITAAG